MSVQNPKKIEKKYQIGILTSPTEQASVGPISNLITILKALSSSIVIITGNAPYDFFKKDPELLVYDTSHPHGSNYVTLIFNYIQSQFKGAYYILKNRNNVDLWLFFMGGNREILPILTARLLRKPTLLLLTGSIVKSAQYSKDPFILPIKILDLITCNLVNGLIVYSPKLIPELQLEHYPRKIYIAQRHFIDIDLFKCSTNYEERSKIIGYIGRFSGEKGVLNFVNSFPGIHSRDPAIHFFIGGEGVLLHQIRTSISMNGLDENVTVSHWISHDELPVYLNRLKLLVLPSYTEGLPNILLESMACGTPVIVTSVGAVSDVITDQISGFILQDNSPLTIENSVLQALNYPDLKKISDTGRDIVDTEYRYENAVESYAAILSKFLPSK